MKVTLVFAKGKLAGQSIPLTDKQYVIGRHRDCEMCVKSSQISVHHCAILIQKDKALVRDFDSTNGTFVNNVQVKGDHTLKNGDLLRVGSVLLKVVVEAVDPPKPKLNPALSETAAAEVIHDGSSHDCSIDDGILGLNTGSIYETTALQQLSPFPPKPSDKHPKPK